VTTRSELLRLLSEAAELEHGIACSYLYAAFSLKRDIAEGGMTWEEQQTVRRWASQIYFVASQEMLHLALVWNLTTAIGGTPYYGRPNFPQDGTYYPLKLPIALEPFGLRSLRRFIAYEHPGDQAPKRNLKSLLTLEGSDAEDLEFGSIADLYSLIAGGFENIDEKELFLGSSNQQMTPELVHFPDLVAVVDRSSALTAIERITRQGEGTATDREDSHFGAFVSMFEQLLAMSKSGSGFSPARPTISNPSATNQRGYGANPNPISDELTQHVATLFDSVYGLMLRMLAWAFEFDSSNAQPFLKAFCGVAIDLMPRVILPLGEGLTRMPAGPKYPGKSGGAAFGLTRVVTLPPDPKLAQRLCLERLEELAALSESLLVHKNLPVEVRKAFGHLRDISSSFVR
jgi:hypothetical protein